MNYTQSGLKKKQLALNSKGIKLRKMFGITFIKAFLICLLSAGILGICLGIGMFNGIIAAAPDITPIDVTPTGYASYMYDSEGHQMKKLVAADSNRISVGMDKIPENLANAFVAIEDERFYEHNGIDIKGIMRAGYVAVTSKDLSQGASTITQQLIKNNVFENWKTKEEQFEKIKRKIQEQYLATELEKKLTKSQILELYMNSINLGQNTLGVQAASLRYFNKPVYELTLSECAVIAGITQNPSKYNPISHPDKNAERREKVLKNMLEHQYITKAEYEEALNDDVYERIQSNNIIVSSEENNTVNSYFEDATITALKKDFKEKYIKEGYTESQAEAKAYTMIYSGGLQIYTTMDPVVQSILDEVTSDESNYPKDTKWLLDYKLTIKKKDGTIENHSNEMVKNYFKEEKNNSKFKMLYSSQEAAMEDIEKYKEAHLEEGDEVESDSISLVPQPQISITIEDQSNGHVLGLIGGRGSKETSRSLNRATDTTRQPGSTFKVVSTYAPALDAAGLTLATTYYDGPFKYSTGRPVKNWYSGYKYQNCSIRYAIEQSLNIITVKTLTEITPQLGYDYLLNFGFTTLIDRRVEPNGTISSDITQALALGGITEGVKNVELNGAYATIANKGIYYEPILYTKVLGHDGEILIDNNIQQDTHRVLKESTAYLLTSAMTDVVSKGTGGAVNFPGQVIAGKTGTTSDNYDVWFAGFTPYYTCTAWTGYDINVTMNEAEKKVVKTIWKKSMQQLHEGLEKQEFQVPATVVKKTVCSQSGKLARGGVCDGSMKTEYFDEETIPKESCDVHYTGFICASCGKRANDLCPFKIPGSLLLPLTEAESVRKGSGSTGGSGMCPHNSTFFSTPGYRAVLEQELAILQLNGLNFSLDGY